VEAGLLLCEQRPLSFKINPFWRHEMSVGKALLLALMLATPVWGQTLEEKAREIEGKLMAPCCWSSPVSQHYSQAAEDIRRGVRGMLASGKSEQEILDYYVSVYGERILASPRPRGFNLLAWVLPAIFFIAGVLFLAFLLRRWTRQKPPLASEGSPELQLDERCRIRLEEELRDFE
jgi:cytochrome c-type biogenesis protein CcmH